MTTASLLLSALLGTASASVGEGISLEVPKQTLSLGVVHGEFSVSGSPSLAVSSSASVEEQYAAGRRIYDFGQKSLRTGGVIVLAGVAVSTVGLVTMLVDDGVVALTGLGMAGVGGLVSLASLPVMVRGGRIAGDALEGAGVGLSRRPRRLIWGGAVLMGVGMVSVAALDQLGVIGAPLFYVGGAGIVGGSVLQMREVNRAFDAYEQKNAAASVSWGVSPMVSPEAKGLAIAAVF